MSDLGMRAMSLDLGTQHVRAAVATGAHAELLAFHENGQRCDHLATGAVYTLDSGQFQTLSGVDRVSNADVIVGWIGSLGSPLPLRCHGKSPCTPHHVLADALRYVRDKIGSDTDVNPGDVPLAIVAPPRLVNSRTASAALLSAARSAGFRSANVVSTPVAAMRFYRERHHAGMAAASNIASSQKPFLIADAGWHALTLTLVLSDHLGTRILAPPRQVTQLGGRALNLMLARQLRAIGVSFDSINAPSEGHAAAEHFVEQARLRLCQGQAIRVSRTEATSSSAMELTVAHWFRSLTLSRRSALAEAEDLCRHVGIRPSQLSGVGCTGGGFCWPGVAETFDPWTTSVHLDQAPYAAAALGAALGAADDLDDRPALAENATPLNETAPLDHTTPPDQWIRLQRPLWKQPNATDHKTAWSLLRYNAEFACGYALAETPRREIVFVADVWDSSGEVEQRGDLLRRVDFPADPETPGTSSSAWRKSVDREMHAYLSELGARQTVFAIERSAYRLSDGRQVTRRFRGPGAVFECVLPGVCAATASSSLLRLNYKLNALRLGANALDEVLLQTDALAPRFAAEQTRVQLCRLVSGAKEVERRVLGAYVSRAEMLVG